MLLRFELIKENPLLLLYMLPALVLSLTLHEWAHAFVAYKCGDPTARNLGRMTLNPIAHFDLIGSLCLLLVGFGWAKPVPINPRNFQKIRRDTILVSLAGVAMNFLMLVFFTLLMSICIRLDIELLFNEAFMYIMQYFIVFNLSLMLFNLIPLPPLDGYNVLETLLVRKLPINFFMFVRRYGRWILLGLLLAGSINTRFDVIGMYLRWGLNLVFSAVSAISGVPFI